MNRLRWLGLAFCPLAFVAACDDRSAHVFMASRYDATADCLGPTLGVDVVEGPDQGACNTLRCWISPGGEVYVSYAACDAPPDYAESSEGPCKQALSAYEAMRVCPQQ